jgi:hypothetical protein
MKTERGNDRDNDPDKDQMGPKGSDPGFKRCGRET